MGVARIFFRRGETLSKKFSKNIQKILEIFLKNLQKIFYKIFKKIQNFFLKIYKIFKEFSKKFLYKNVKNGFFGAYFSKNLTNPAFNFCAFGRKTHILWKF